MSNGEVKSSRVDETSGGNKRQLRSTVAPTLILQGQGNYKPGICPKNNTVSSFN